MEFVIEALEYGKAGVVGAYRRVIKTAFEFRFECYRKGVVRFGVGAVQDAQFDQAVGVHAGEVNA